MKKFHFKLEALILQRTNQKEIAQKNLYKIRLRLREETKKKKIIQGKLVVIQQEYGELQAKGGIKADELMNYITFIRDLKVLMARQFENIEKLQTMEKEAIKKLVEADRNLKITEKLKENQYQKYIAEEEKSEQKELDEIAILKFAALRQMATRKEI